jgi:hypothetical protein
MSAKRVFVILLLLAIVAGICFNQWQLQREVQRLSAANTSHATAVAQDTAEDAAAKLRQAQTRYDEARTQLQIAEQKLATANAQLAALDTRLRQLESGPQSAIRFQSGKRTLTFTDELQPPSPAPQKRAWGPEQVVGDPDTFQAGDISTAWAPREQDGGEEWLKLDYEKSVDIAEVRVRETYNPGAISKVTAFLANGAEVTLWEGIEPPSQAPVEMSFQVPESVHAKSVKVYLDTKRVPGWNEIDAVQIVGRDGSQQWVKEATASSTYAEPRVANQLRGLERF